MSLSYHVGGLPSRGWKKEAKHQARAKALEKMKVGKINIYDDASGITKEKKSKFSSSQALAHLKKAN